MNEPDFKELSEKHKISTSTLRTRYRKQGLRGDDLIAPVQTRSQLGRKGGRNSPWRKVSPSVPKKSEKK